MSPDIEVNRDHESPSVGVPVSAQRDLDTGAAPSTALPIAGNKCAFHKSPDISVCRESEPFGGTPVNSVLQYLGTRVTSSIALPLAGDNCATNKTSLTGETAPQNGTYLVESPEKMDDSDTSGKDTNFTKEHIINTNSIVESSTVVESSMKETLANEIEAELSLKVSVNL